MSFHHWRLVGLALNFLPLLKMGAMLLPLSRHSWLPAAFLVQGLVCFALLLLQLPPPGGKKTTRFRKAELRQRLERLARTDRRDGAPPRLHDPSLGGWRWLALAVNVVPLFVVSQVVLYTPLFTKTPIWTVALLQLAANVFIFGHLLRPDPEEQSLRRRLAEAERRA
jgi:hypothetical protein